MASPTSPGRTPGGAPSRDPLEAWLAALEARYLEALTFQEVARSARALSSAYVERRGGLSRGRALEGRGKRAAFALLYGPLHFLLVRQVVCALDASSLHLEVLADVGCGTLVAGVAWATVLRSRPRVIGFDRHRWALDEAEWMLRQWRLRGHLSRVDADRARLPGRQSGIVAAFAVNELGAGARARLLDNLRRAARQGASVLVVEPIATSATPWWDEWRDVFVGEGGRADLWRFEVELPDVVKRLDRAAGLRHDELTGRSLWLPAQNRRDAATKTRAQSTSEATSTHSTAACAPSPEGP